MAAQCIYTVPEIPSMFIEAISFSPDGKEIAVCCQHWTGFENKEFDGYSTFAIDIGGAGVIRRYLDERNPYYLLAHDLLGRWIAFASHKNRIEICDLRTTDVVKSLQTDIEETDAALTFSPDGQWLVVAGLTKTEGKRYKSYLQVFSTDDWNAEPPFECIGVQMPLISA
ncbi:MAG TPA: hypothetical protein VFW40_14650 [Capsulimonadaceae bacterium]|nr:hypothetical protein [Capsulimonadaceae bacterium]